MTSLRFIGDVPLWAGALAACLLGGLSWWYYYRERGNLPPRLRWLLPGLRALAVILTILVLTGPVIHHRHVRGQLGRVLFFVDGSRSMSVADKQMPTARKLIVAQQQGWVPPNEVDMSLWNLAGQLAQVRRQTIGALQVGDSDTAVVEACRRRVAKEFQEVADRLRDFDWSSVTSDGLKPAAEIGPKVLESWRAEMVAPAQALLNEPLNNATDCQKMVQRLVELCNVTTQSEDMLLRAFDAYGDRLTESGSSAVTSALAVFDNRSRWQRAENSLLNAKKGLVAGLKSTHQIELYVLSGPKAKSVWDPKSTAPHGSTFGVQPTATVTDLATGIAEQTRMRPDSTAPSTDGAAAVGAAAASHTAVVLISDGQQNADTTPLVTARTLGLHGVPIYTIGYGCRREPPDLALLRVEHPDKVFQKDRVRGTVVLKDRMPPGQSLLIQIRQDDQVLWQQREVTQDVGLRRVECEFSIDQLVEKMTNEFAPGIRHHAIPLALDVSITPLDAEMDANNNATVIRFMAITQNHKLLLLDGRPRWETRYLRNLFQRDDQWHVDAVLVGPATEHESLPRGSGANQFPHDEETLYGYDLIVFGDLPPGVLNDREQRWIRDFVEKRGGGIVFIDGQRGGLRQFDNATLGPLLPISWFSKPLDAVATKLQLTDLGAGVSAFALRSPAAVNRRFWEELPAPHRLAPVEAVPGAEVLVEAVVRDRPRPAIVTRTFGAGRVLYMAFDETWRWRYKVADRYHQRFWNQVARWIMSSPFTVSSQYMSLDSGPPGYTTGQAAAIRVKLRGVDGKPLDRANVDALIWKNGEVVATVALTRDDAGTGLYRGRTAALAEGSYEVTVRATGMSRDALNCKTQFVVVPPPGSEMQYLACNDELLTSVASESKGRFLREEQIGRLADLLRPLSTGRVVESDTLLWQSYWWFAAIVGVLAVEWMLRKRAGLL